MVEQARQPDGAAARVLPRPASSRRLGPLSRTASAGAIRQPAQQSLSPGRPASALAGGSASGVRWELPTAPTQPAPPRPAEGAAAVRPASSSGSMARAAAAPLASSSAASYAGRPGTAVSSLGSASSIGGASFSEVQPAKVVFTAEQRQRKPAPAAASLPGRPATAGTRADDAALALLPTAADAQLDVAQRAPLDPFACTLPFYREETPLEAARAPFDSLAFKRELSEHVLAQVGEVCHAALGSLRAEVTEHLRGLQKLQGAASAVIADVQTASKVVLDTATAAARTSGADAALPLACSGGRADGEGHGGSGSFPARGGPHATGHAELSELLQAVAACQAALDGFEVRQVTRETEAQRALRELRDAQREHGAVVAELSGALRDARDASAGGLAAPPAATLRPQQTPLSPTAAELLEELRRHSDALGLLPRVLQEIARDVSQVLEQVRVQGARESDLLDLLEEVRAAAPPEELVPLLRELCAGGAQAAGGSRGRPASALEAVSPSLPSAPDFSPVLEEIRRASAQLVTQEVLHEQVSQEILREVQRLGQLQASWL
ncbi:unnamed protein product [Prorocentrum cordatum]|uniref:Uncharacterized protein n=1 Tax=Prorocentrum cordatum TaxID=2364126 RepID=A0ABN9UHW9_9DINO|nr:unnamed protein product [Polarella glacialis]|mmetsp:Transcript_65070/g.184794  ORF Transcript_65070/g.184794 Transcript_65070/m.184794 type:complete len:554 (-) Transcript_65070:105-1766(-)